MLHYTYDSDRDLPSTLNLELNKSTLKQMQIKKAMTILWSEVVKWQLKFVPKTGFMDPETQRKSWEFWIVF